MNRLTLIRPTWGHYGLRNDVAIAFILGRTDNEDVQKEKEIEMNLYDDILLANVKDSYKNSTLKSMAMLEWTGRYCSKADYLLKADDDVFINVENLIKFIEKVGDEDKNEPKFYGRFVEGCEPVRSEDSQYFLPFNQFSETIFPDFETGRAYLFSTGIVQLFFEDGLDRRFLQLEDVFMTGVIAEALNVTSVRVTELENTAINVESTGRCELSKYISNQHPHDRLS
jgi:small-conductance mechanosensitive channel